ncbi:MAG: glutaredoxin domain-containing protein [Microgenomates group bacterium]
MKITVYTITECQFSKQEKEYLLSHGIQFEEKNVSSNREFLTEMLAVGSNFAGTPVTKIDTDDGKTVVLKGFTKEEFDKTLGFEAKQPETVPAAPQPVTADAQPAVANTPAPVDMPPVEQPVAAPTQPAVDPAMASILNNLEQQVQEPAPQPPVQAMPPQQPPQPTPPPGVAQPTIPDPQF